MRDGRHIAAEGARKLSRQISRWIVIPMLRELLAAKGTPEKQGLSQDEGGKEDVRRRIHIKSQN